MQASTRDEMLVWIKAIDDARVSLCYWACFLVGLEEMIPRGRLEWNSSGGMN